MHFQNKEKWEKLGLIRVFCSDEEDRQYSMSRSE